MTARMEFKAKSVQQALRKASRHFEILPEQLEYEVVQNGGGILGLMGLKKAVVLAAPVREKSTPSGPEPPTEKNGDISGRRSEPHCQSDPGLPRGSALSTGAPEKAQTRQATQSDIEPAFSDGDSDAQNGLKEAMRCRDEAQQLIERIVRAITDPDKIESNVDGNQIYFQISGGQSGMIIGKRGQTLEAIHYLVEKAVNKRSGGRIRIHIDVEGYMAKRRHQLIELARKMAQRTRKSGRPASLGQMNAYDRRIVHLALKEDNKVRTQSIGEGHLRKMVIFPKKGGPPKRRDPVQR